MGQAFKVLVSRRENERVYNSVEVDSSGRLPSLLLASSTDEPGLPPETAEYKE